jgi:aminomuconate-semialdehyde/2-hydroxymuconate-6-semialdehyde dehydrogenase
MTLDHPSPLVALEHGAARLPHRHNYIGGRFVEGGQTFLKRSPVHGREVALVGAADAALVDEAVRTARRALAGPWGRSSVAERASWLDRIAQAIDDRAEALAAAESLDTGKPLSVARLVDIPRAAANFRTFAALIRGAPLEAFALDTADGQGALNYAIRKPLGVVAVIVPWNLPLLLLTWKVAPALACGNAVVVKPSEETPSSATLLAEIVHELGLPAGVFNLVHGFGPNATGEFLTTHPDVDGVTFTGESSTGSAIMRAVAPTTKPVSFELGGKNAAVVFADADFEQALAGTVQSVFSNCGQVCLCTERVYVERPIFERFVTALSAAAGLLHRGWPSDPASTMGPLISAQHREKVRGYYALALSEGATVVTGGGVPTFGDARDGGNYVDPTIWVGLPEQARCVKEEVFGPVCHIAPFDAEEQAVALANDTRYGLASAVWTTNLSRGHRVAQQMRTGVAWVNCWFLRDLRTPFGGMGLSGVGREGGRHSLDFYSELTNVCVKL